MILLQVMQVTTPVFGVAALGYLYGRLQGRDMDSANRVNMNLFVPALLFYVLSEKIPPELNWAGAAIGATIVVLGSGLLAWPVARLLGIPGRTLLPSMMFNNSGNLGLPLAALAFGDALLPLAVVAFVVSAGLNFSLGIWYLSGQLHPRILATNPVFLATAAGIGCNTLGWHTPEILMPGLEMLSGVAIPLMLVALGVRLTNIDFSQWGIGLLGALLAPLTGIACALAAYWALDLDPDTTRVLILFGALPPAVMNFLLAERYQQDPAAVASIVALGNLASILVIPPVLFFILPAP